MDNKTLKITSNFGNRYELAQARISKNPFYKREDWLNIVRGKDHTDLDLYIAAIENSSNIDVDKFYEDYNYKYADSKTRVAALTNEYMKDKMSSSVHTQERYVYDANGNIVMKDGEPVTEKYEVSDYDYYKTLIKEQNDHNYQMFLRQREQERKDSLGGFGKFAANVGGVALEFASGFTSVIDGVIDSVASIGDAIEGAIAGERLDDAYAKAVADDEDRPFADFQQWAIEFENRYSDLRDLDGNYTNFGKYAGGIATSVGQMLPSILIAKFTPRALGAAGVGASTATKVAGVASQAVFYESIAANNIRDMYNTYTSNGVSISSAQIINNAIIKSAVEISVEKLLGKMLGGSALDNLVFGRTAGKTIGAVGKSTLTNNAMLRILKDAGQEGLEEVLQDTGTFLVDRAYTQLTGENFNELEDLSFQSLIDAFVIGAIVSVGGSAVSVIGTSGKAMRSVDKGGKFAAWEYGLNVQSFVENYDIVMKANEKTKSKLTQAALTEMYASYRIVSSIYGEIGYERFKAANDVLTKITEDMEAGKYDVEHVKSAASDVYNTVFGEQAINKQIETEIKEALITSIVDEVERGEELVTLDESINKEIEELYKKDTTLEKVAISKDGTNVVRKDGTIIVPKNLLKNSGANMVIKSSNENDLVKRINDNKYFSLRTDEVLEHYKKLTGNTQASKDEAIRALLFDPDCALFEAMLVTSNKDMYKFLSNLVNLMKNLKVQNASDAMYKNTVKTSVKNMTNVLVQYLKNQQNADYNIDLLTDAQKQNIAKTRWCKDLYSRVVRGDKLSKTDITVLENRVNGMPVDSSEKEIILNKLKSQDASVRASAMNNIDYAYDKVFTTLYDGDTYLPQAGIPNVAFNNYLQRLGLNLKTLLSESSLTESDIANIQDSYGEITPVTILKFRTEQFSLSVNNAYTFENSDGKYYVVDNSGKRVGYSNYNRKVNSILQGDDVIFKRKKVERTVINAAGDLHNIVRSIVRLGVDKLTANMLSITDVIVDSTLLNDDIKKSIEMSYGRITPETTFMYLREYVLENTGDISIAVNPDGEYIFVNVKPMKSSLKTEKIELTSNETKASEIFKEELLTGMLADLRIVLTDDDIVAEYRPAKIESVNNKPVRVNDNAIYVNRNIAKQGGEYLTFALLHEFQHAIQYENKMNLGMDSQFLKQCSKKVKNAIIADVKKHKPNLFTGNPDDKTIERRVSEFIYHTSGESTAMGMDASPLVDFYPTIVKYTRDGAIITFPWGSSFNLEKGSILLGINIDTSPVSNKLNDVLVKNTKPYTLEQFMANPKTCFVMPNGQLRTFDEGEHYDVIKSVDSDVDRSYWDTLPQVVVEDDFASVKITGSHTNDAIMTTLSIMDTLYDIGMEFTLGEIYYEDANPYSVTVSNDEAENSDDLLQLYSRSKLEASGKMSLIELADNVWEIEWIGDFFDETYLRDAAISPALRNHLEQSDIYDSLQEWTRAGLGDVQNSKLKSDLLRKLTSEKGLEYRRDSLAALYSLAYEDITFEEFLETDLPFARCQLTPYVNKSDFVSVYGVLENEESLGNLLYYFEEKLESADCYLIVGTYKPKDLLAYIPNNLQECLIPVAACIDSKVYKVFSDGNGYYVTTPDGRVITEEEVNTDLGAYIPKMSLAKPSKTIKTETETPSKPKAKSRYLSQKEAKGTPLENFYKKGDKTEMSDELKAFVKGSVDVELPYDIADKIKDGTLKTADVMDWFRNTPLDIMDQKMFELINKSYYKNNVIKTPKQLQEHIYDAAYYYATRAIVRASGNQELLFVDDDKITKAQTEAFRNISDSATMTDGRGRKVKVKNVFSRIVNNYYYKGKNQDEPIDISEKYAKTLWMHFYDGSLQTAGRIASISKWTAIRGLAIAGELKTLSLDAKVDSTDDESDTLLELTEDKAALQEMVELVTNSDVSKKEKLVRNRLLKGMITLIQKKYGTTDEAAVKAKLTWRKITQMSADELNSASIKALLSELLDVDYEKVMNSTAVENAVSKVERTPWSVVNNTNYHVSKIRKYLPKAQLKLFLKENSDLFTEDLKLRPEVTKKLDAKGRLVYRDTSELLPVFEKVKEIAEDVKMGAYQNRTSLNQFVKAKRIMLAVQEDYIKRLKEPVKKAKDVKTVTIEVADDVLNIDTTKPMPKALERILDFEFTKPVKSRTQYITNEDDYHFEVNNKVFTDTNAEYLASLTQQDVDDIIDYYTNSEILKLNVSESKYRLYNAVKLYMSVYLLSNSKSGRYILTEEQYTSLEKSIELMISPSAQLLATWKGVKNKLNPEKIIINSLKGEVKFSPNDIDRLTKALDSGDIEKIQEAKQIMYENAKKSYTGKESFIDKLLQFERMAMLSGPGTWVRNYVSNAIIGGIQVKGKNVWKGTLATAEKVGESASNLIMKLFPNKKWNRENQYKITGTAVTSDVKTFIDVHLIKSGLLNELSDGLSKYDTRKSNRGTNAENLTEMIRKSIATKIFYANASDIPKLNMAYEFIFKHLSDDKFVTRNMVKYLGKMLTEDNVDVGKGINAKITDYIAEAYTLAAQDYMHRTNVWNKIDAAIRDKGGPAVYFAYKQFLPFASTSWNWFLEGLKYTPAGLVDSIVKYAKLEKTIDKLDEAKRKGDQVISSRFAEYIARRNIGKGVIGTIGTVIGILLAAFGVAKLDEEDDKYKLTIGAVTVDISDVFSTQGIFMGMAMTGSIIDSCKNKDFDVMDVFVTAIDTMLIDSAITDVWTTIRYNETAGEWFAALPMQTLNNVVPNFLKTLSNITSVYDVKYDAGILGKVEKLAVDAIPGLAYAMPKQVDIYTGENQIMYKAQFLTDLVNRLSPLDIAPLNISEYEQEAYDLGVHKKMLNGKYSINDKNVILKARDVQELNVYYGKLNKKDLDALLNDQLRLKVKNEKGTYSKLLYSQMTEKQKKAAFTQIMGKNSQYAQVYILTSKGYKYYASESEYMELRKLGVTKNVYRKTNKLSGFVEP